MEFSISGAKKIFGRRARLHARVKVAEKFQNFAVFFKSVAGAWRVRDMDSVQLCKMTPHWRQIGKCRKVGRGLHATRGATRQKVQKMLQNTYFWICSLRVENWIWEVRKMKNLLCALEFWVDWCQLRTTGPIEQIVACVWSFVHFFVLKRWLDGIGWILDIYWG